MKKSLLAIGTILATGAPVAGAVSCTLIKKDNIENFTTFKNSESISDIISTFNTNDGANIGISPWLSSFWKERSNKLLGALNYKTNKSGIIASNGFDLDDVRSLSRLLEAQTWLEYGGYDAKSLTGEQPTDAEVEKYDIRLSYKTPYKTVSDLKLSENSWLNKLNITYGKSYKENDKIKAFVNGKLQEFSAWNTDNTEGTFVHSGDYNSEITNVFKMDDVSLIDAKDGDIYDHSKTEYEEIEHRFGSMKDDNEEDIQTKYRNFVQEQIVKLLSDKKSERYNFVPKLMGTKINFYIAYNKNSNADAASYDKNDITVPEGSFDALRTKIKAWFKSYGIDINVIDVPLNGEGNDSKSDVVITSADTQDASKWGKPFDNKMLTEIANSNKKALVYMPIDSWLNSGKPKGSLLLQKRKSRTVGDATIYSDDNLVDTISVDEPKLVEQMNEIYSSFSDFVAKEDYSLLNFFDTISLATRDQMNSKEVVEARDIVNALVKQQKNEALAYLDSKSLKDPFDELRNVDKVLAKAVANGFTLNHELQNKINEANVAAEKIARDAAKRAVDVANNGFLSKWINLKADPSDPDRNKFVAKSNEYREQMKNMPYINKETGNIEYRVGQYYTTYNTQFVFSPDISLSNDAQRYFSQALDAAGPRASNNYTWSINARNSLPLPITVGYTNDDDKAMRSNILNWIKEHFII